MTFEKILGFNFFAGRFRFILIRSHFLVVASLLWLYTEALNYRIDQL